MSTAILSNSKIPCVYHVTLLHSMVLLSHHLINFDVIMLCNNFKIINDNILIRKEILSY